MNDCFFSNLLNTGLEYYNSGRYIEAIKCFEEVSNKGDAKGSYYLALCYLNGKGVNKDEKKAFQLLLLASDKGYDEALFELAQCYKYGKGTRLVDEEKSIELYIKSAKLGNERSQYMVGKYFMSNHAGAFFQIISERDTINAFSWFMKSAEQGYHLAQREVGAFYESGTDPCIRNLEKALFWYTKAANQGNPRALFAIGRIYSNGLDEINSDNKKAFEYYLMAANKGLREAQYRVGIAFLFGKGVEKDRNTGIEWIKKSAENGYGAAKTLMIQMEDSSETNSETEATGMELVTAIIDEYGVLYSQDEKKLLRYSMDEGYGDGMNDWIIEGDEDCEFGEIKQQSLNYYKIKDGTEIICDEAFSECESLFSVSVPSSVKTIGSGAFSQCENLESIELNDGLEIIGSYAFKDCNEVESITLPHSLKSIEPDSFIGVQSIISHSKNYVSANNCLYTADMETLIYFFHNGVRYLDIPYGVKRIGDYAFSESNIQIVNMPKSLVEIGGGAFYKCEDLEKLVIPQSVSKIGGIAFCGCERLYHINLPSRLEIIESETFSSCHNLKHINLPESIKSIGSWAFACTDISEVVLPRDLEEINFAPYEGCHINRIVSKSENYIVDGMAIYSDAGKTFIDYYGRDSYFAIPTGVETIADFALASSYLIKELLIPRTIKNIGKCFLEQHIPDKIYVSSEIKNMLIEKVPSCANHIIVIDDDCN